MIVKGLDRIEGTPIYGMSDEHWRSHTAELRARFAEQHEDDRGGAVRRENAFPAPYHT
eukprot:COSAG06_NODE_729_length_12742_cov_15.795064_2_plen_58_part_00